MPEPTGALSWRDVYKAVNESEKRIIDAIGTAVTPLKDASSDHENRIRSLEREGSVEAREAMRIAVNLETKHETLASQVAFNTNRQQGMVAAMSVGKKFILLVISIIGGVAVVIEIVSKLTV